MSDLLVDALARDRSLPVLVPSGGSDPAPALERLRGRGLGLLEVALRRPGAEEVLAAAVGHGVLVGAGTVLTAEQVDLVVGLGAGFVVTPGWAPGVVARCQELGVPVLPGVATAGEVMAALAAGLDVVKLFPAAQLGGPAVVRALAGPFPGLRVVPSGGVTATTAPDYLAEPAVLAVSGSWLVEP